MLCLSATLTGLALLITGGAVNGRVPKFKSQIMCEEYAETVITEEEPPVLISGVGKVKTDHCGIIAESLIVGGQLAAPKEFPHMALIGYGEEKEVHWLCGGSLISKNYILSAAHCAEPEDGPAKWATLGDLKVLEDGDDADPVTVEITERVSHPNYDPDKVYNDIALFKLKENVEFGPYIRPACLHRDKEILYARPLASGWGHTRWKGTPTQDMMKVQLKIQTPAKCNSSYKSRNKLSRGFEDQTMICAGGEEGRDTCQGDSGGPLQYPLKLPYCMYSIIGVTSFGAECGAGKPGVYTRISHYADWIENIVWK